MYLNDAQISLTGYVATQPLVRTVKSGATNLSMRVAWTPRRQDRVTGEWADGNTSYVTVICWRKLATNGAVCLRKGDPVVVKGRLSIRSYDDKQGVPRIAVEVEATSVGHDLSRGVATFQRVRPQTGLTAAEFAASSGGASQQGDSGALSGLSGLSGLTGLPSSGGLSGPGGLSGLSEITEIGDPDFSLPDGPEPDDRTDPGPDDPFLSASSVGDYAAGDRPVGDSAVGDSAEAAVQVAEPPQVVVPF
jgi:single-strand DNA-binding protein